MNKNIEVFKNAFKKMLFKKWISRAPGLRCIIYNYNGKMRLAYVFRCYVKFYFS